MLLLSGLGLESPRDHFWVVLTLVDGSTGPGVIQK